MKLSLLLAVAIVLFIFLADVVILAILKRIGGVPKTQVRANIKRFGGNLSVSSIGLVGSFLAIAVLALVAIYLITKLSGP